jgi:hypothetical protein
MTASSSYRRLMMTSLLILNVLSGISFTGQGFFLLAAFFHFILGSSLGLGLTNLLI